MAAVLAGLATEDVARLVAAAGRAEEAARAMRGTEALLRAQVDTLTNERNAALALVREMTSVVEQYEANINPESVCASVGGLLTRARALLAEAGIGDGAA